jgi:hypothetical protein
MKWQTNGRLAVDGYVAGATKAKGRSESVRAGISLFNESLHPSNLQ